MENEELDATAENPDTLEEGALPGLQAPPELTPEEKEMVEREMTKETADQEAEDEAALEEAFAGDTEVVDPLSAQEKMSLARTRSADPLPINWPLDVRYIGSKQRVEEALERFADERLATTAGARGSELLQSVFTCVCSMLDLTRNEAWREFNVRFAVDPAQGLVLVDVKYRDLPEPKKALPGIETLRQRELAEEQLLAT